MSRYSLAVVAGALVLGATLAACTANTGHDDAEQFLEAHGWSVIGPVAESSVEVPSDFWVVTNGLHWRVLLDLSKGAGLDFSDQAGQTVKALYYPVESQAELAGSDPDLRATLLLDQDGRITGAWVTPVGLPGAAYSIDGQLRVEVMPGG